MKAWQEIKFGDLYLLPSRNGINRPSGVRGIGYRMINMGEIFKYDRIGNIEMERVLLNDKEKENFNILKYDLIFARQSIVAEGAGKCSIVLNVPEITCFESHIIRVRLNENIAIPKYFYYFFQSDYGKAYLSAIRQQGVQAGIRGTDLEKLVIPNPPFPTQQYIASILSAYDDLIEINIKRIKLLEELGQRTYEEWFVKFIVNNEKLKVNKESGLPEGWGRKKLNQVAHINKKSIKAGYNGKLKYVDISSVSTGKIDSFTEYEYEDAPGRARRIVSHGDIIWSCVRPNRKSYSIIWNPEDNLIASTGFAVITPFALPSTYLYQCVTTDAFVGYLTSLAGGVAYPAVTSDVFNNAEIVFPAKYIVDLFDEKIKPINDLVSNLITQNKHLKESRDILLPRLMNGKIEVEGIRICSVNKG